MIFLCSVLKRAAREVSTVFILGTERAFDIENIEIKGLYFNRKIFLFFKSNTHIKKGER